VAEMCVEAKPGEVLVVEGCASVEDASILAEYRPMTFQVTMSGIDGMVMASDQCEFDGAERTSSPRVKNLLRKVAISGTFAWAFSDGRLGPFFSPFLQRALDSAGNVSCDAAIQILESCGRPVLAEWKEYVATGPAAALRIVFACGMSKRIFRVDISPYMTAQEIFDGKCISGNYYNLAAFLPRVSIRQRNPLILWRGWQHTPSA